MALTGVLLAGGCAGPTAPDRSASLQPASTEPAAASGGEPTPVAVLSVDPTVSRGNAVPCRPDAEALAIQFGAPPPPVDLPAAVPTRLPGSLVPEQAAVYAVGVPGDPEIDVAPWVHYLVGPAGMTCAVTLGTAIEVTLTDPGSAARVRLVVPRSEGMHQLLACRYIDEARIAATAFASPEDCEPDPAETVAMLTTTRPDDHVALVQAPDDATTGGPKLAMYLFQGTAEGGASQGIECRLPATRQSTCIAGFAFFLAQAGLPSDEVRSIMDDLTGRLE